MQVYYQKGSGGAIGLAYDSREQHLIQSTMTNVYSPTILWMLNYIFESLSFLYLCTDMLFEEDTTLLSFFDRYAEEDDYEDLQDSIKKYCGAQEEPKVPLEEQNTTGDSLEGVSRLMIPTCINTF